MNNRSANPFRIKFRDYFIEYSLNRKFKEIIDSGNFVYADERLVINDARLFEHNENGELLLTDYAEQNQRKCCLIIEKKNYSVQSDCLVDIETYIEKSEFLFENLQVHQPRRKKVRINSMWYEAEEYKRLLSIFANIEQEMNKSLAILLSEASVVDSGEDNKKDIGRILNEIKRHKIEVEDIYLKTKQTAEAIDKSENHIVARSAFDISEINMKVFESSKELKKLHDNIIGSVKYTEENKMDFARLAWTQMERCHCHYKENFREKTLLSDKTFDRIKSGQLISPDLETVMAICIGLNLGIIYGESLLKSAGYDLAESTTPLHKVYHVLLCTYHERTIFEWNEVLEALGLQPIRAKAYKEIVADRN